MISPSSMVRLIKGVPLSPKHQLTFDSVESQTAFFLSKAQPNAIFDDFSYQRDNATMNVPINSDEIYEVNYCMYQNSAYTNKWFYAYVTRIEYINDYTSRLTLETDAFQSWMFEMQFKQCMVEREHTRRYDANGNPIKNMIDEGLDIGDDYVTLLEKHITPYPYAPKLRWAIITCKASLRTSIPSIGTHRYCGATSTLEIYAMPLDLKMLALPTVNGSSFSELSYTLQKIESDATYANRVVSVTISSFIPYNMAVRTNESTGQVEITSSDLQVFSVGSTGINLCKFVDKNAPLNATLAGGYKYASLLGTNKTKESKLLMYPYTYIEMCDYKGNSLELKIENFSTEDIGLRLFGSIGTENYSVYSVDNYNDEYAGYTYSIIDNATESMPVLNNHTATYIQGNLNTLNATKKNLAEQTNMAQSMNLWQTTAGAISGGLSVFGADLLGGIGDVGTSLVNGYWASKQTQMNYDHQMRSMLAKYQDIQRVPNNISAQGSSNYFNMIHNFHGVFLKWKQIRPEKIKLLEQYFMMFGYKVDTLKVPSIRTRESYNYIKTIGCLIGGNLPQTERLDIETMFDNGITLWHDGSVIGDYSVSNNEV